MLKLDYSFVIEMLTPEGTSLGQFPVPVDWEPAREYAHFTGLRRKPQDIAASRETSIEPVWDQEKDGEPYATGARLVNGDVSCEVEKNYFRPLALDLSSDLIEKNILKAGDLFLFRVLAYRQVAEREEANGVRFTVRDTSPPVDFADASIPELLGASVRSGADEGDDVPVFIPQSVLDEAEAITREAGSMETGGILIGNLHRDAALPEIGVVVTAQIPARHTHSKKTSLTFTAETWTAVQSALNLRRSGELMVGWWHSHPSFAFCNADCPPERRQTCALQKPFLSSDDLLLHRTVFPKAWCVALLANHADAGLEFALYGWRRGVVQHRAFNTLGARPQAAKTAPELLHETSTGEPHHATHCQK